jgi:hypothetical protein
MWRKYAEHPVGRGPMFEPPPLSLYGPNAGICDSMKYNKPPQIGEVINSVGHPTSLLSLQPWRHLTAN